MNRKHLAILSVVGMLALAGCLDVTMTVEVSEDGDVDAMEMEMEMDAMLFEQFETEATEEGHESVAEMFEADMLEDVDEEHVGDVTTEIEELDDGDQRLTMQLTDVDPAGLDDVDITVEDGTIVYEDADAIEEDEFDDGDDAGMDGDFDEFEEQFEDQISMEYVLVMPGEITDHNADEISEDGTTATWDLMDTEAETVYAESEIEDDGIPGFGVAAALGALLLVAGLGARLS